MNTDKIVNFFLPVRYTLTRLLNITPKPKFPRLQQEVREDYRVMTEAQLDDGWMRSMPWGQYHPGGLRQWFDPKGIKLTNRGVEMSITRNELKIADGFIPRGVGMLHSRRSFTYGFFNWNIVLPKGALLWPAVWLSCEKSWPPEIDVLEAYSDDKGKFHRRVETNIHCGNQGPNHYALGTGKHGGLVKEDGRLSLKLHWQPNFIKIYYNDYLVRVIRNKRDLSWFNIIPEQVVIVGNGTRDGVDKKQHFEIAVSPLILEDFSYSTVK